MTNIEQASFDSMDLGSCCICGEHDYTFPTIIMLGFKGPPGCKSGWGCVVCGLEQVGAVAVLCNECVKGDPDVVMLRIKMVVGPGYFKDINRTPFDSFEKVPHLHDCLKHGLDEAQR